VGVLAHSLLKGEMVGRNSDWTPRFSQSLGRCSMEAQKFILAPLAVDPAVRPTASQALGHSWIQDKDANDGSNEGIAHTQRPW
jgi:serine/threonine protein kinase